MNLMDDKIDTGLMIASIIFFCLSYFFPGYELHLLIVSFFFAALKLYRDYQLKKNL